jgi:nucleotide-binding universal stress UspA family protein
MTTNEPTPQHRRSIVLAVDGSRANRSAVAWAAYTAHQAGVELELVHVVDDALQRSPLFTTAQLGSVARRILDEAADQVTRTFADVQTTEHIRFGHPASMVRQFAEGSELLVLGRRGHGGFTQLLLGSVSARIAAQAAVPTVVVPKDWEADAHASAPVVVGINDPDRAEPVLRYAMELASRTNAPLDVLHVVAEQPAFAAEANLARDVIQHWQREAADLVRNAVEPWREKYPQLQINEDAPLGHVAGTLCHRAANAQALVVGSRRAGAAQAILTGSVTYGVLLHAQCPVITIPGDG